MIEDYAQLLSVLCRGSFTHVSMHTCINTQILTAPWKKDMQAKSIILPELARSEFYTLGKYSWYLFVPALLETAITMICIV